MNFNEINLCMLPPETPNSILLEDVVWPKNEEIYIHLQHTPWIMLPFAFDAQACLAEAMSLLDLFVVHREQDQACRGSVGRKSLALISKEGHEYKTETADRYGRTIDTNRSTPITNKCPVTMHFLQQITDIDQCERVTFMLLEPGAEILTHYDSPDEDSGSITINVALNMFAGCDFWVDLNKDGTMNEFSRKIPIVDGSIFIFNSSTCHKVINNSDSPRFYLIIHGPTRISWQFISDQARKQNETKDYRHGIAKLAVKKALLGETSPNNSNLFKDLENFGFTENLLPRNISLGVAVDETVELGLRQEALQITKGCLHPQVPEVFSLAEMGAWLEKQAELNKDFAIICAAGTYTPSCINFILESLRVTHKLKKNKTTLAGHIINKANRLPYLHEQFLIINIKKWMQICHESWGMPDVCSVSFFPKYLVSEENIHSNYTPLWIKKFKGNEFIRGKEGFGTNILANLLTEGEKIENIPHSLRALKDYCYPREGRKENYERVSQKVAEYLSAEKERVYVFNTEPLKIRDYNIKPNLIISPCAGLKPLSMYHQFSQMGESCRVLLLEKNRSAIRFYEDLLACSKFGDVLLILEEHLKQQQLIPVENENYVKKRTSLILNEAFSGSQSELMSCLSAVAKKVKIIEMDYFAGHDEIASHIEPDMKSIFWHSNAWESNPSLIKSTPNELRENYKNLLHKVASKLKSPAWIHKTTYEAVFGENFYEPKSVFTIGGTKINAPKKGAFEQLLL